MRRECEQGKCAGAHGRDGTGSGSVRSIELGVYLAGWAVDQVGVAQLLQLDVKPVLFVLVQSGAGEILARQLQSALAWTQQRGAPVLFQVVLGR